MNRLPRLVARLLDYTWMGAALFAAATQIFNLPLFTACLLLIFTPTFFIPVEAISTKLFKTTLGKALCRLRYNQAFTLKEAIALATKKGLLLQPLFFPFIQVFFGKLYHRELRTTPQTRFDETELVRTQHNKLWKKGLLLALGAVTTLFTFFPQKVVDMQRDWSTTEYVAPTTTPETLDQWTKVSPEDFKFTVFFPSAPARNETRAPIPNSSDELVITEYHCQTDLRYGLALTEIPKLWTIAGGPRILKMTVDNLAKHTNTEIQSTRNTFFGGNRYPAMEYTLKQGQKEYKGFLVSISNMIYRLEVSAEHTLSEKDHQKIQQFFSTFTAHK